MQLALKVAGLAGVVQLTEPWNTLQPLAPAFTASWQATGLATAPGIWVALSVPPPTMFTAIDWIVSPLPKAVALRPSAKQVICTVAPAATPAVGETVAIAPAVAAATAGAPVTMASAAYTNARILMVPPELQAPRPAPSRIVKEISGFGPPNPPRREGSCAAPVHPVRRRSAPSARRWVISPNARAF